MARRQQGALLGVATAASALCLLALARAPLCTSFLQLPRQGLVLNRVQPAGAQHRGPAPAAAAAAATAAGAAAALAAAAAGRQARPQTARRARAAAAQRGCRGAALAGVQLRPQRSPRCVSLAAWPWEDDDPYSKCTALKLQVGLQFSKNLLDTLNRLAESADTQTDEGLHQLMLDVVLALRRAEASWRYGNVERKLFDSEDEGREANSALQRWGIDAQSKWGDGEQWEKMDKNPSGTTEYLIITVLVSCYGTLCPKEENLKVRSGGDMKKVLEAISGVQADELMQLDVQWIPEEEGDSMSAMEVTMKFPELAIL